MTQYILNGKDKRNIILAAIQCLIVQPTASKQDIIVYLKKLLIVSIKKDNCINFLRFMKLLFFMQKLLKIHKHSEEMITLDRVLLC